MLEESRVNSAYLHNGNIVIKQCRGVAPTLVGWGHVKCLVKFTLKQVLTMATERARKRRMQKVLSIMYGVFYFTTFSSVHDSKF